MLAIAYLLLPDSITTNKRPFDYRIQHGNPVDTRTAVFMFVIIGTLLYFVSLADSQFEPGSLQNVQQNINYWALIFFAAQFCLGFTVRIYKWRKYSLPPPESLSPSKSSFVSVYSFVVSILLLELIIGNVLCVAIEIYGNNMSAIVSMAALDLSLIIFGLFILIARGSTDKYLARLASLERDIVVHGLNENQIIERLQDEFLGQYVGDWMEKLLKEVREQSESVSKLSSNAESFIQEISQIDNAYPLEKKGRVEQYIDELDGALKTYDKCVRPLLVWLNDAQSQSILHKDEYILSLISTSTKELEENTELVQKQMKDAISKLRKIR